MTCSVGRGFGFYAAWVAVVVLACATSLQAADTSLRDVIDKHVADQQAKQKVSPASPATDAQFMRRLYLDLVGTIPTHDDAKAFIDDKSTDKRAKLIDRLLDDPRYAQHQTDVWDMVWFGRNPPGYDADKRPGFHKWLAEQFNKNTPYDRIVSAMLKAEGNTAEHGAPYYLVQYRNKPQDAAQAVAQRFLGVQLQCARCHDHPYEPWKQVDFYGMAAFYTRLSTVEVGKMGQEKKVMIGEQSVGEINFTGPAAEDGPGKKGVPIKPKFLATKALDEPTPGKDVKPIKFASGKAPPKPAFSRKDALADWVTARDNPYFARAAANRIWAQFMGRGIVDPVDDMSKDNKPSHPELLDALTQQFVAHNFDMKWYVRELCNSKTYQAGIAGDAEHATPKWYERAKVKPLSAEQLSAAWRVAVSYHKVDSKLKERLDKGEWSYPLTSGYVLRFFGKPSNGEGHFQGGLHEHLFLNNGGLSKLFSRNKGGLYHTMLESKEPWEQKVDRLFLSILSRYPDDAERAHFVKYLSADERPDDRVREAMWALMTCSEFRFNH